MESFQQNLRKALPDTIIPAKIPGRFVIIDEPDPVLFWNRFTGALGGNQSIVILDPAWPDVWKQEFSQLAEKSIPANAKWILVPTSGTTGKPRFCIHTSETLSAAAHSFAEAFGKRGIIHSINVLPQHHVGGFMPVWRSAYSGGKTIFTRYTDDILSMDLPFDLPQCSISLVPTQLSRLIQSPELVEGLRQIGMMLVGGAACPPYLLEQCRQLGLNLAPCYGSTETAAMVTVLDPQMFISGNDSVGKPLPGNSIEVKNDGLIEIDSNSIHLGYLPESGDFSRIPMKTSDLGKLDDQGYLHVIGRIDRVIITGGKKVIPEQVESTTLKSGWIKDAWCRGITDPDWGSRVELTVVPKDDEQDPDIRLMAFLRDQLPAYAVPKIIHLVDTISRNEMGKRIH